MSEIVIYAYIPILQVQRLRDELTSSRAQLATWDERINQARAACAAWQLESEEAKRKASIAEQQRDEVNISLSQPQCLSFDINSNLPYFRVWILCRL